MQRGRTLFLVYRLSNEVIGQMDSLVGELVASGE